MTALASDRSTPRRDALDFGFVATVSTTFYAGALVCISTATGYALPGATATTLRCVGVCQTNLVSSAVTGADKVIVKRGCYRFGNSSAGDLIAAIDIGASCYVVDDQTVAKTSGTNTRSIAGVIRDVDAAGVWVEI